VVAVLKVTGVVVVAAVAELFAHGEIAIAVAAVPSVVLLYLVTRQQVRRHHGRK